MVDSFLPSTGNNSVVLSQRARYTLQMSSALSAILRLLLAALAILTIESSASAKAHTAAVMPLGMGAGGDEFKGLGRSLADMMVTDFSQAKSLQLVERAQLGLILDELKLSKSGYLDKKSAQRLGRGLGAKYIITGTFSVVRDKFTMDCRIFDVQSGVILKSAHSSGPIDDFVAVEKDVVEKMLDGLAISLSLGQKRKMQLSSPTENVRALAKFGQGVEAGESGRPLAAKRAFEQALKLDPDFAKAALALADLATAISKIDKNDRTRRQTEKERTRTAALAAIPSELSRAKNFVDTQRTLMEFAIRQYLLELDRNHCQRYAELKHYLLRKDGMLTPWFRGLRQQYTDSYRAGEATMATRLVALGLISTTVGHSPRMFFSEASGDLVSGKKLLVWSNISAEYSALLSELALCHPANVQMAEFDKLVKLASRWSWYRKSLNSTVGEGPSTITVKDSLDLYWASLRARHRGVDRKVRLRTDAVLARHPQGDPNRYSVVSGIKGVVGIGKAYEVSKASRFGQSRPEILSKSRAALAQSNAAIWTKNAFCADALAKQLPSIQVGWDKYQKLHLSGPRGVKRRSSATNTLGHTLAPLLFGRCFRVKRPSPRTLSDLKSLVVAGLKRPHPKSVKDAGCADSIKDLRKATNNGNPLTSDILIHQLTWLHSLQIRRCLIP